MSEKLLVRHIDVYFERDVYYDLLEMGEESIEYALMMKNDETRTLVLRDHASGCGIVYSSIGKNWLSLVCPPEPVEKIIEEVPSVLWRIVDRLKDDVVDISIRLEFKTEEEIKQTAKAILKMNS